MTVTIDGTINGWSFAGTGDKQKIRDVSHWGTLNIGNSGRNFEGAYNLQISALDTPDLTGVTTLSRIFQGALNTETLEGNIPALNLADWDVSGVQDLSLAFANTYTNGLPLGSWDTSSATSMAGMFSSATTMHGMFVETGFNGDITRWNVSKVTDMSYMFVWTQFHQDISGWDVSSLTNMDFMFHFSNFNQDISSWDVRSLKKMQGAFSDSVFDQDIGSWDVTNVTNMSALFEGSALSTKNYDKLLKGWASQDVQRDLAIDVYKTPSTTAVSSYKTILRDGKGWTITDGGEVDAPEPEPTPTPTVLPVTNPTQPTVPVQPAGLNRQSLLPRMRIPKALPKRGLRALLAPHTKTNAGKAVTISVSGKRVRNGKRLFRIITRTSGPNRGRVFIRTYGRPVTITISWRAVGTSRYIPFKQTVAYRI